MLFKNEFSKIVVVILIPIVLVALIFSLLIVKRDKNADFIQENSGFSYLSDRQKIRILIGSADEVKIGQETLEVEVVNTIESTVQGLSGRSEIGTDGMLFIFPKKQQQYFWMKDMKLNLDIVWIADQKVVGITKNVPKPEENTSDNRLEIYPSSQEADMVLELVSGDSEKYGIKEGKTIQLVE